MPLLPAVHIETERLILRPHNLADFDAWYAMFTDKNCSNLSAPQSFTRRRFGIDYCAILATGRFSAMGCSPYFAKWTDSSGPKTGLAIFIGV